MTETMTERIGRAIRDCEIKPDRDWEWLGRAALNEVINILYEYGEDQAASVLRDRARAK